MTNEKDENGRAQLQINSDEFQALVQDAVEGAIVNVIAFLLGVIFALAMIVSGIQTFIHTSGAGWIIIGVLNIAVGIIVFWWAVFK